MWWPLANFVGPDGSRYRPQIDTAGYNFEHVLEDIESLNQRSQRGELEITALSIHQYPFVADRYALTSCGSSMGDGYGPMVVTPVAPASRALTLADFLVPQNGGAENGVGYRFPKPSPSGPDSAVPRGGQARPLNATPDSTRPRLAIPGLRTTAWLAFQLLIREQHPDLAATHRINFTVLPFDQIIPAVERGDVDAGLIIHEGQLVYEKHGLRCLVDLGRWWKDTRNLPLPLGGNAIRRDLGHAMPVICDVLKRSIDHALQHRDEAVRFALQWARGMDGDLADQFVGMYVNRWTLDYGHVGRRAVEQLLTEAAAASLIPDPGPIDFVAPDA
jgi:1,4-dihydroxy-6-naphthoate synthase